MKSVPRNLSPSQLAECIRADIEELQRQGARLDALAEAMYPPIPFSDPRWDDGDRWECSPAIAAGTSLVPPELVDEYGDALFPEHGEFWPNGGES